MSIYNYEPAFGAGDKTTRAMRRAIGDWFSLYYQTDADAQQDPCQRIAYTVVNKIARAVFGEYRIWSQSPFVQQVLEALDRQRQTAVQQALIGGECYLKPCPEEGGFGFAVIPRDRVLIFSKDSNGDPTDMGLVEKSSHGKYFYTLLERRTVDANGFLTIENRLFRSLSADSLGSPASLGEHPAYRDLAERYTFDLPVGSVGLVRIKTPMVNCVDGSSDGVSVYAAAAGLIANIDKNEAQLNGEFLRGESRVITSSDMLGRDVFGNRVLKDHLFVGLDEDPDHVGITVYSPALREQSFLNRKQEYLRNVESLIGLKRGMLSDSNLEERTATEIAASNGEYSLTVMDFQKMWQKAVQQTLSLCKVLGDLYGIHGTAEGPVVFDWGNGVLYDEAKAWAEYMEMADKGMIRPELVLGWRFHLPVETEEDLAAIRLKYMPAIQE